MDPLTSMKYLLLMLAMMGLLAACGAPPSTSDPVATGPLGRQATTEVPGPDYAGPLAGAVDYAAIDVHLRAPAADVTPAVSWTAAWSTCRTMFPCAGMTTAPVISLAVYSDNTYAVRQPDGSLRHPHQQLLAWVMRWRHVACLDFHGSLASSHPAWWSTGCDQLVMIDAMSGQFLMADSTGALP